MKQRGCLSIYPHRSVEATESALGLLPSVGPWGHSGEGGRNELYNQVAGTKVQAEFAVALESCLGFKSVAPGSVIKTVADADSREAEACDTDWEKRTLRSDRLASANRPRKSRTPRKKLTQEEQEGAPADHLWSPPPESILARRRSTLLYSLIVIQNLIPMFVIFTQDEKLSCLVVAAMRGLYGRHGVDRSLTRFRRCKTLESRGLGAHRVNAKHVKETHRDCVYMFLTAQRAEIPASVRPSARVLLSCAAGLCVSILASVPRQLGRRW